MNTKTCNATAPLQSVASIRLMLAASVLITSIGFLSTNAQAQIFSREEGGPGIAAGANGQQRQPPSVDKVMRMDRNGDGQLSPEEMPERARDRLIRADFDGNGMVSREELETAFERMREMRAQKGAQSGGAFGGQKPPQAPSSPTTSPAVTPPSAADDAPALPSQ